jgi:hypothetical protein
LLDYTEWCAERNWPEEQAGNRRLRARQDEKAVAQEREIQHNLTIKSFQINN